MYLAVSTIYFAVCIFQNPDGKINAGEFCGEGGDANTIVCGSAGCSCNHRGTREAYFQEAETRAQAPLERPR